jgi:hypothetical protein
MTSLGHTGEGRYPEKNVKNTGCRIEFGMTSFGHTGEGRYPEKNVKKILDAGLNPA